MEVGERGGKGVERGGEVVGRDRGGQVAEERESRAGGRERRAGGRERQRRTDGRGGPYTSMNMNTSMRMCHDTARLCFLIYLYL